TVRRRKFLIEAMTCGMVACLIAVGLPVAVPQRQTITWHTYLKIQEGMTEAEVRRTLGDEGVTPHPASEIFGIPITKEKVVKTVLIWTGPEAHIHVGFDDGGAVRWKLYTARSNATVRE